MVYQNGYWPDSALVTVQGSGANAIRLNAATAAILRRMQADALKDGVRITLVASYHGAAGYRSWATQLDMRAHPGLYNITPGIVSGLPSGHGDANCFDIDAGLAWVKADGAKYGVTFPLAFDHNHGRYDGVTLAGETGTPLADETPENHLPEYGGADVALVMNRTQDNVIAIYDESHWQEFAYTSTSQPSATVKAYQLDFAMGQAHALPNVPYDAYAWNLRSNSLPALKRPLFTDTGSAITPIVKTAGDAPTIDVNALAESIVAKLPGQQAALSKQDVIDAIKSVSYKAS